MITVFTIYLSVWSPCLKMSLLQLANPVIFKPLSKFSKKTMQYVEDDWHHATLTMNNFQPFEDMRYNDLDYADKEILHIITTYGVRTPHWMNFKNELSDDEFYQYALDNINNPNFKFFDNFTM